MELIRFRRALAAVWVKPRHTFASQWVLAGGSIEKLSTVLGHCSVVMTERYVHLRPDLFGERILGAIPIDLSTTAPEPAQIVGETWAATSTNARAAR